MIIFPAQIGLTIIGLAPVVFSELYTGLWYYITAAAWLYIRVNRRK